jgi:acylphosphatase
MRAPVTLRAHVVVSGRVQGVNFRWHTQRKAQELGLTGWVRNLWDGRVEATFEGPDEAVRKMVNWCHSGSPMAQVDDVQAEYEAPAGDFGGFHIR